MEDLNQQQQKPKQISTIKNFFAGGFGGICLVATGHPLDTVKIRMQTMSTLSMNSGTSSAIKLKQQQQQFYYTSTWDCIKKIFHYEGIRGFYKGMSTPLIGITPLYSICFFGYSLGKKLQTPLNGPNDDYSAIQIFYAGMLSSIFTNFLTTPGERIKCLLQIQHQQTLNINNNNNNNNNKNLIKFNGPIDCAIKLYKQDGLRRGLYRGTIATLLRDVPAGGVYFVTYETLQKFFQNKYQNQNQNNYKWFYTLFSGGMSGIVFWLFALPADVIKSHLQISTSVNQYPNGMRDVIKFIAKNDGPLGFYRGAIPVFLRSFPANASCFFGYELAMKIIELIAPDL